MPALLHPRLKRYATRAALLVGAWAAVVIFTTSQLVLSYTASGGPAYWRATFQNSAVQWLPWILFAPAVISLTSQVQRRYHSRAGAILVHLIALFLTAAAVVALTFALRSATGNPIKRTYVTEYLRNIHSSAVVYGLIAAASIAALSFLRAREREADVARLEVQLADARFAALQGQLHPHFLFNTLHGVTSLIHESPDAAEDMLTTLGDLLRITLGRGDQREVSLRDDIGFLERYLEIHRMRMGDRLRASVHVSPTALDCLVPAFVLQPLVENAIRYAIAPRVEGGRLDVHGETHGDVLRLDVVDDGPGIETTSGQARSGWGIGIENTKARLEQLFGDRQRFSVLSSVGAGTRITIEMPARTAAEPPAMS